MNTHIHKMSEIKSQAVANKISKQQNDIPSNQSIEDKSESNMQRKLQRKANNSSQVQQLKDFQKKANRSKTVIQGMFTLTNEPIADLGTLNVKLLLPAYANQLNTRPIVLPIAAVHFNQGQTAAEVDTAVNNSNLALYDYIEVSDIWDAIDAELIILTAPPLGGYLLINNGFDSAYILSPFALTPHQEDLLIRAVHGQGNAVHQSALTHNMAANADAYIHDNGANAIFSYQNMGNHRNFPMVQVLQQGNVNAGQHNF